MGRACTSAVWITLNAPICSSAAAPLSSAVSLSQLHTCVLSILSQYNSKLLFWYLHLYYCAQTHLSSYKTGAVCSKWLKNQGHADVNALVIRPFVRFNLSFWVHLCRNGGLKHGKRQSVKRRVRNGGTKRWRGIKYKKGSLSWGKGTPLRWENGGCGEWQITERMEERNKGGLWLEDKHSSSLHC